MGLAAGQVLERIAQPGLRARTYALPAYLTAYVSLIVGTMLTAHLTALLALVLLGDALLLAFAVRRLRVLVAATALAHAGLCADTGPLCHCAGPAFSARISRLLLFPGAAGALALGVGLDRWQGAWRAFSWAAPVRWPVALAERFLGWWALPFYLLGFGLATAAPLFASFRSDLMALYCLVLAGYYGWAVRRFRLPLWLLGLGVALHGALAFSLNWRGWWQWPDWAWLDLLPVRFAAADWRDSEVTVQGYIR